MAEAITFHYDVDGENFTSAGNASVQVKRKLRHLGFPPDVIKRVAIAMYEGEINMVIHADGGSADVIVSPEEVKIVLADSGPGIPDVSLAMKAFSANFSPSSFFTFLSKSLLFPTKTNFTSSLFAF